MTRMRSQVGFTIVEMMIAVTVMMAVTGAIFQILNPAQGTFQAQPEVSDMQQRMRVGVDTLQKDLVMAGAGAYQGATTGALVYNFAPIMPYKFGGNVEAPVNDAISLIYVPTTPAVTSITKSMPSNSAEIKVADIAQCTGTGQGQLCGFKTGMRVLIYDAKGHWDTFTITHVQDAAGHIQHQGQDLSYSFGPDSAVSQVMTQSYYLKSDAGTNTYQLMYYDGYQTDAPVVDNVVKLEFSYYGDPLPPQLLPKACFTSECKGGTTYGPNPPGLGVSNAPWPDGENCAFTVVGGAYAPRLATLGASNAQVNLPLSSFSDGPWCPAIDSPDRFDADLLRVRRVRVKLRVQAALASLRGPAGALFMKAGTSSTMERYVPDQEIQFDVVPRNMNLGR